MLHEEVCGRCDVCREEVASGLPEERARVLDEFRYNTAEVIVAGRRARICNECVMTGRFFSPEGERPELDRHKNPVRAQIRGPRQFALSPARNRRFQVVDADPPVQPGECYKCGQVHPGYEDCDPNDVVAHFNDTQTDENRCTCRPFATNDDGTDGHDPYCPQHGELARR